MPRVKGKAFVLANRPNARSEKYRDFLRTYWLIRFGRTFMYYAEGATESLAWKAAAEKLERELAERQG
jgi:hypothetical protein